VIENITVCKRVEQIKQLPTGLCWVKHTNWSNTLEVVVKDYLVIDDDVVLWYVVAVARTVHQELVCIVVERLAKHLQLHCLSILSHTDATPCAEPNNAKYSWGNKEAYKQLSQRATSADSCDKDANKGRPDNPATSISKLFY
jgi:hypothetical protein